MDTHNIIHRIDELLAIQQDSDEWLPMNTFQMYTGCVTLVSQLYGSSSPQFQALKDERARLMTVEGNEFAKQSILHKELHGLLKTLKTEIQAGLIHSLSELVSAEVYADFLALAKNAFESSKDVAAVLASAALEDALKRFAMSHALVVDDKDMTEVIAAVKAAGLLKAPEAKVVQSYVTLRNKALHAEWDKINAPEVSSLMAYVESFVLTHLSVTESRGNE